MYQSKNKGFTIIELVVVIVIIGILAAVALPRFLGLQDRAHDAVVECTQAALASGVLMAHSLWMSFGRETALDDVMKKTVKNRLPDDSDNYTATNAGLDINKNGYPVFFSDGTAADVPSTAYTAGPAAPLGAAYENEIVSDDQCKEVFDFLMSQQSVKTSTADVDAEFGSAFADSFEFSAENTAPNECTYTYIKDKSTSGLRKIVYSAVDGSVSVSGLTESTFSE